jgi:hypothetical protein
MAGDHVALHPIGVGHRLRRQQDQLHLARAENVVDAADEARHEGVAEEEGGGCDQGDGVAAPGGEGAPGLVGNVTQLAHRPFDRRACGLTRGS